MTTDHSQAIVNEIAALARNARRHAGGSHTAKVDVLSIERAIERERDREPDQQMRLAMALQAIPLDYRIRYMGAKHEHQGGRSIIQMIHEDDHDALEKVIERLEGIKWGVLPL